MKKLILAVIACVVLVTPAYAVANDPKAIILDVYAHKKANFDYEPPKAIYTPRLAKLFADNEAAADKAGDPALDVDIWVNAQDFQLGPVMATEKFDHYSKSKQIVTTKVTNFSAVTTVVFYFEQIGGKWLLDDMRWTGKDGFTLSLVLKYGDWGPAGEK